MGQPETAQQPKDRRAKNFSEVSYGFVKTIAQNEARRCPQCAEPICNSGCPLGIDIPGFIRALREGDAGAALSRIKDRNPLPGVCGRVCLAPCESSCVFADENAPIAIRALERFAADNGRGRQRPVIAPSNGKTVAVIGSGPSGLTAAADLARNGFTVTIYEAFPQAGGVLRYGIPEFRLPSKALDAEINDIVSLGVVIQTNVVIGEMMTFEELAEKYNAILLATGSGSPKPSLTNDHLVGVYYAQEFLMRVNMLGAANSPKTAKPALIGNKIVVIGSGYAAIDCARAAIRLGKKASVIFEGLEEEIIVYPQERKDAIDEGVKFESLTRPLEIVAKDNSVAGVKCERLDFSDDESGKWQVKTVPGSEFLMDADTVIIAGESKSADALKRYLPDLVWTRDGTVRINEITAMTSKTKFFATGNAVTGGGTVVDAMAMGKKAAVAISQYLNP